MHETFEIIEPFLNKHGIYFHVPQMYDDGREDHAWVVHGSWNSGARLIRLRGNAIVAPMRREFNLYNEDSLLRLVTYLHRISG